MSRPSTSTGGFELFAALTMIFIVLLQLLVSIGVPLAIIYVIWHFASKLW